MILVFSCVTLIGKAQQKQGANWLFGGDAPTYLGTHINFNNPKVQPVSFQFDYSIGTAAAASISDKIGELLFFSSYGHVASRQKLNNKYQQMPNGNVLGNLTPGTSAELIMGNPQDSQSYYLFLMTPVSLFLPHDLYVVKIDMRLNNGMGDVVPNSLKLLRKHGGQSMTAILHTNNEDFWLLTSNYSGDSLLSFPVTKAGIGAPVSSLSNKNLIKTSWLKSSPNSERFVTTSKQGIELFSFNRQAGTAAPLYSLFLPDSAQQLGYAFSFSPNSTKLYVGTQTKPGHSFISIVQYDLSAGNQAQIQQSAVKIYQENIGSTVGGIYSTLITDMQLAIDGKIYTARNDTIYYLSQIPYPDQSGIAAGFKLRAVRTSNYPTFALPALNQTLFRNAGKLQAQALRDTICLGDSVQLSAYGAGAEHFQWQAANGLTSPSDTLANPIVKPTATTTFRVIASSPFRTDTAYVKVVVLSKSPATLTGPKQVFTFAESQEYKLEGNRTGFTINWEITGGEIVSGQGTSSIRVNWGNAGTGLVEVSEINRYGCLGNKLSLPINISGSPLPVFYNIVTPNGDCHNETFTIANLKWYPQNSLQIFNRWGKQLFETGNYQNDWPQTDIPAGTYYYLFRDKTTNQKFKGWLEVVK